MLTRKGSLVRGWARHFLEESNGDNEVALEAFFKLVAEFGQFRVVEGEFVDLPPGHARSKEFMKGLHEILAKVCGHDRPVPRRIQLVYLLPDEYCFLKSWQGDEVVIDHSSLYPDAATARKEVAFEFAVSSDEWTLRSSG